jgi:hypothetical protein
MLELALTLLLTQGLLLLLIRPLILWYFRVNRMVRALESIDASLKCLPAVKNDRLARHGISSRAA